MPATSLSPATAARVQRALQHAMVTPAGIVLLETFKGRMSLTTWDQLGASVLGAVLTWLLHNQDTPGRRYLQAIVPVLVAAATAAIPVLSAGGDLAALGSAAGVIPLLHVLAGAGNAITPTRTSIAAGQIVTDLGHEMAVDDIAPPPTARTGGEHQRAISPDTTTLKAITQEMLDAHPASGPPSGIPAQATRAPAARGVA